MCWLRGCFIDCAFRLRHTGSGPHFVAFVFAIKKPASIEVQELAPVPSVLDVPALSSSDTWEAALLNTFVTKFTPYPTVFLNECTLPEVSIDEVDVMPGLTRVSEYTLVADHAWVSLKEWLADHAGDEANETTSQGGSMTRAVKKAKLYEDLEEHFPGLSRIAKESGGPPALPLAADSDEDSPEDEEPSGSREASDAYHALLAKRFELADIAPAGNDFFVDTRGGNWCMAVHGVPYDKIVGRARPGEAAAWLRSRGVKSGMVQHTLKTWGGNLLLARSRLSG